MKSLKTLGLTTLASLMALAFVGASSAMAESTQLCKVDSAGACAAGNAVTSIHEVSVGKAKLLASPEIQCNVLFSSTSVGALGAPQSIEGHLTYSSCGSGCSVAEENGPATIKFLKEGHEKATVALFFLIHTACFGIDCYYETNFMFGSAKGPLLSSQANGEVTVNNMAMPLETGALCPSSVVLDLTMTPLTATYIAS